MSRRKQDYRIKLSGYRDGQPFFDLVVEGRKYRLDAATREAAEGEAPARFAAVKAAAPVTRVARPALDRHVQPGSLRAGFAAYFASETFRLYKPLTTSQRRSLVELILTTKVPSGRHTLGETKLSDWLLGPDAADSVRRIMSLCGAKAAAANHRLNALDQFFIWLLGPEPQAAEARLAFQVGKRATNPCRDVAKAQPRRSKEGTFKRGYTPFTNDQVEEWLTACKDDADQHRAVRLMLMTGARLSDLVRLNRTMIKSVEGGRVLTYTCEKGRDSAFRPESVAMVPLVPELEALIAELPRDRLVFIESEWGRPYSCTEGLGNRIRKWRRACGLPEGLSAHGMRKAATHWWLRNHRELIANNFSLKTIFGWATDKELERYTRDFDRAEEARGMLVRLADRRKAAG
jgi:integrase